MPRGVMPRRPAKTGRHEGARLKSSVIAVSAQPGKGRKLPPKSLTSSVSAKAPKKAASTVAKNGVLKGYNPTSPERVAEILKRLDQLYPDVTCALTHASAWELVVATILSAQSTDVNVNRVTPELFRKYPTVEAFAGVIVQIAIFDLVFSVDSVVTAVGMAEHLSIMIAAVVLAMVVMLAASGPVADFVHGNPTVKMLALSFLLLIGMSLLADSMHVHIPRGYLYFAVAFSGVVEALNQLTARRRKKAQAASRKR